MMNKIMKTVAAGLSMLLLVASIGLLSGCKSAPQKEKTTQSFAALKLNDLTKARISIADDGLCSGIWNPKSSGAAAAEIEKWLKEAQYNVECPSSSSDTSELVFAANIGPSSLELYTADKRDVRIAPAFEVTQKNGGIEKKYYNDVLAINDNGQKSYIKSHPLYDWLKNNKWKAEFKR